MSVIGIADLHLTSTPRDAYRWRLFPWLAEQIVQHRVEHLLILGDLTESKNYHSGKLVNEIVDTFAALHRDTGGHLQIVVLPGNHDGLDPECPYFRFLGHLPFIRYISVPTLGPFAGCDNVLFLPHTKEPEKWGNDFLSAAEVIFMHQTFTGAKSETGFELEGMSADVLFAAKRAKIWSGDVHVPQKCGRIEYVGSPYPVRFGDSFQPRAVLLTSKLKKAQDLAPPGHNRMHVRASSATDLSVHELGKGDQIKISVPLKRSEFGSFDKIRRELAAYCSEKGVEICGLEVEKLEEAPVPKLKARGAGTQSVTPEQILKSWSERQKLEPHVAETGQRLLKAALGTAI